MHGRVIVYFLFSKRRPSAILDFSYFFNFCEKFKFAPISSSSCKVWWKSDDVRPIYCLFSNWRPSAILEFYVSAILWKIEICPYIFVFLQNLVKIGLFTAKLLRIFNFQNGGRPPSWVWYDVIAYHQRLVFDGPNILLKLHVYHVNILQDRNFYIWPIWLEIACSQFWGIWQGSPWNWLPAQGVRRN